MKKMIIILSLLAIGCNSIKITSKNQTNNFVKVIYWDASIAITYVYFIGDSSVKCVDGKEIKGSRVNDVCLLFNELFVLKKKGIIEEKVKIEGVIEGDFSCLKVITDDGINKVDFGAAQHDLKFSSGFDDFIGLLDSLNQKEDCFMHTTE